MRYALSFSCPAAVDADRGGMAAVPVLHHGRDATHFPANTARRQSVLNCLRLVSEREQWGGVNREDPVLNELVTSEHGDERLRVH